jgi:hypothetical protein
MNRCKSLNTLIGRVSVCALWLVGCGAELSSEVDQAPLSVNSAALASDEMVQLRVRIFEVDPGFDEASFPAYLSSINTLFLASGIQLIYDGKQKATSTVCTDTDRSQVAKEGSQYPTVIPVFYCNATGYGSQTAENFVIWNTGVGLDHEIAHYLSLPHTFNYCWTASQGEADRLNQIDATSSNPVCTAYGRWKSVEERIQTTLTDAAKGCPDQNPQAITICLASAIEDAKRIRDELLDGDRISDTPLALHVYPDSQAVTCAPGYRVPLLVNVAGNTYDYSFEPGLNNRMDYFDCQDEGPDAYSPTQIEAMRNSLSGLRADLEQTRL